MYDHFFSRIATQHITAVYVLDKRNVPLTLYVLGASGISASSTPRDQHDRTAEHRNGPFRDLSLDSIGRFGVRLTLHEGGS